jgi:tetratricopeptide (TPR) repeat protein
VELPPPQTETELAAVELDPVTVEKPEPPREVTYEEAESAFLENRYDEAAELFVLYTERKPNNPWGYYMLGLSARRSGDLVNAEAAFRSALEFDPLHLKSHTNLSRVLLDTERADEALLIIDEVLVIDSEFSDAYRLQGRAHHQLGRFDDAIDSYRQAILIDDEDVWSMNNMGLILIEQERFQEALLPLARAVALRDDVAIFHNNLGVALERTGHIRAAEDVFRVALTLDEGYEKVIVSLARVEELEEDSALEPVDLSELAQSFIDEVEGWRESVAYHEEWPGWEEQEPIIVGEADAMDTIPEVVIEADTIPAVVSEADTTGVEKGSQKDGIKN